MEARQEGKIESPNKLVSGTIAWSSYVDVLKEITATMLYLLLKNVLQPGQWLIRHHADQYSP